MIPAKDYTVLTCAWPALTESSRVYMIYLEDDAPAGAELTATEVGHVDLRANAAAISQKKRGAQFLCDGVLPWH